MTKARKNQITGITIDKLDRATMSRACLKLGIEIPPDTNDEQLSVVIYTKLLESTGGKGDHYLVCETCGGASPEDKLPDCPYCKEDGGPTAPALSTEKAEAPPNTNPGKAPKEEATPMTIATEKAPAKADTKNNQMALAPKGALASVTPISGALAKFTVKDLDAAVKAVQDQKSTAAQEHWELGKKIAYIYDNQLWKLRDEDGKPRYRTVDAFCAEELGMSPPNAWKTMDIAKAFTKEQVGKFGKAKLGLVLQAPLDARPALLKAAEEGASKRKIEEQVRAENKKKKTVKARNNGGKETRKAGADGVTKAGEKAKKPGPKAKPGKATITVASITGTNTILLYKTGAMEGENKKNWTRAKRIADQPTGTMQLENDVYQTYTLVEAPDGTLKLRIVTKRVEA